MAAPLSLNFDIRGTYRPVYYDSFLGLPYPVWVFIGVAICGWLLLNRTAFGRYCTAIGSNEAVAKYSAINVDRVKTLTYVIQGLCVSFATIIYVPRLGSASASTGVLWELEAIAAVIIGGTVLKGGYGRIGGTILGALILTTIGNILELHRPDLELPEWNHAGPDHHRCRSPAAQRLEARQEPDKSDA